MRGINVSRMLIGGIVAGVLCWVGDGVVHGVLLKDWWQAVMAGLGRNAGDVGMRSPIYFVLYDLAKGLVGVWLYAAIRPRFGPGPRTAVLAALATWALVIPIPLCGLIPMEWFGRKFALAWSLYGLVPVLIGVLVGSWLYREGTATEAR